MKSIKREAIFRDRKVEFSIINETFGFSMENIYQNIEN